MYIPVCPTITIREIVCNLLKIDYHCAVVPSSADKEKGPAASCPRFRDIRPVGLARVVLLPLGLILVPGDVRGTLRHLFRVWLSDRASKIFFPLLLEVEVRPSLGTRKIYLFYSIGEGVIKKGRCLSYRIAKRTLRPPVEVLVVSVVVVTVSGDAVEEIGGWKVFPLNSMVCTRNRRLVMKRTRSKCVDSPEERRRCWW
jgi:hypothetical protein